MSGWGGRGKLQMKAFAASPCIAFLSVLLLLSLAMAEKNQQKEIIPQEQPDLPMAEHGGLVSDGVNEGASNRPSALRRAPRREWSEVVGLTVEEAKKKIQEDMPMANFQVVPPDCFVTMDFNPRRVRLYVDDSNKVARPPKTG